MTIITPELIEKAATAYRSKSIPPWPPALEAAIRAVLSDILEACAKEIKTRVYDDAFLDRLRELAKENKRLREALKPFADLADMYDKRGAIQDKYRASAYLGDFRRAREALSPETKDET